MDTKITCCFTGHRPKSLPFGYDEQNPQCIRMRFLIWNLLNKLITEKGVTHFISGMALGIDQICAEVVPYLREFEVLSTPGDYENGDDNDDY